MKSKNYLLQIAQAKISPNRISDLLVCIAYMLVDCVSNLERINERIDEIDNK